VCDQIWSWCVRFTCVEVDLISIFRQVLLLLLNPITKVICGACTCMYGHLSRLRSPYKQNRVFGPDDWIMCNDESCTAHLHAPYHHTGLCRACREYRQRDRYAIKHSQCVSNPSCRRKVFRRKMCRLHYTTIRFVPSVKLSRKRKRESTSDDERGVCNEDTTDECILEKYDSMDEETECSSVGTPLSPLPSQKQSRKWDFINYG